MYVTEKRVMLLYIIVTALAALIVGLVIGFMLQTNRIVVSTRLYESLYEARKKAQESASTEIRKIGADARISIDQAAEVVDFMLAKYNRRVMKGMKRSREEVFAEYIEDKMRRAKEKESGILQVEAGDGLKQTKAGLIVPEGLEEGGDGMTAEMDSQCRQESKLT